MLGVHPASKVRGGIASVVDVYRSSGLFQRWPIVYIGTFSSGSALAKIAVAGAALAKYVQLLFGERVMLVHAQTASRSSFWRKSVFLALALAARNLPHVEIIDVAALNPLSLASHDKVLMTVGAVKMVEERWQ